MSRLGRGFPNNALMRPIPVLPLSYIATGAGYTTTATASSVNGSFTSTGAGSTVIVATALVSNNSGAASSFTRAVTYGGVTMTSLGVVNANNIGYGWVELFGLINAPGGTQTVHWTVTGGSPTFYAATANCTSYQGVVAFGPAVTNYGASTSLTSMAITSAPGQKVVQAFANNNNSSVGYTAITGYNQTSRYASGALANSGGGYLSLLLGEAPGASSVTFTGSQGAAFVYGSVAVPLLPL